MTVHQLKESLELTVLVEQTTDKKITGCYIGDLLSWAMSRVQAGDVWLTVMGNINAIAVAALSDAACIILTDAAALDEEAKDQLVMGIKEDANWLLNMVENLLSITRIQSNGSDTQPHVKKVPEPLEEVVSEAIQRYHKRYPDSELKVKIPEDFLMVPMDPTLIEQVIMNLLENAWVHAGTRGPIELDIKEEEKNVVFYVRDHGVGIEPERIAQIFDGCAGAIDHESRKGMGIGLSICKSIVMAHQGDVYARNYEDGAEFSFSLPMDEKELTEEKEL